MALEVNNFEDWSPEAAKKHFVDAEQIALANVERLLTEKKSVMSSIASQISNLDKARVNRIQKIIGIRYIGSQCSDATSDIAACRKGCNHCCHIAVDVSVEEARIISKAIGRPLAKPKTKSFFDSDAAGSAFFGKPCTFLKDGACSIYRSRPFVCQTLMNMDSDDRLCRLLPGEEIQVPYLDLSIVKAIYARSVMNSEFADIREWFGS